MTSEEYDKLTDEEKRIKVAELCGWRRCPVDSNGLTWWIHPIEGEYMKDSPIKGCPFTLKEVPDYLNDLNAMHEAEKLLDNGVDDSRYINRLVLICEDSVYHQPLRSVRATATQRAKAFVLTMGGQ